MALNLARGVLAARPASRILQRAFSTSIVQKGKYNPPKAYIPPDNFDELYPWIGDRDVVGSEGPLSKPTYDDDTVYPFPSLRFGSNTPEMMALKGKEKEDWSSLTVEEKKLLYRHSFCQTFTEMDTPQGENRFEWAIFFGIMTGVGIWHIFTNYFVYVEGRTTNEKWQGAQIEEAVLRMKDPMFGLASKFDYEKGDWK